MWLGSMINGFYMYCFNFRYNYLVSVLLIMFNRRIKNFRGSKWFFLRFVDLVNCMCGIIELRYLFLILIIKEMCIINRVDKEVILVFFREKNLVVIFFINWY